MSWTQVVKDWNKTKVIKDDSGVYALPIRGGDDYKDVRRIYDKIKKKQAEKEIEADKKLQKKIEVKKPAAVKVQKFFDDMSKEEAESIVKSGGFRKLTDDMFDDMEKPKKNLKTSTTVKKSTKMPVKITTFESDDEIEDERNKDRQLVNKAFVPHFYEPERIRKYYDVDAKMEEQRLQVHNILNKANDIAISMNNKAKEQKVVGDRAYKGRADDIKKLVKLWNEYKKTRMGETFPFFDELQPYTKVSFGSGNLKKYFD